MKVPLKRYLALLSEYLRPQSRRVLVLAVLLFSSVGLQLLNPQILRLFIDTATAQGSKCGSCTASKQLQVSDLRFQRADQAARWYSLITPPSTRWCRVGRLMGTVTDRSSLGACWSRDWCGR